MDNILFQYLGIGIGSVLLGYLVFHVILKALPKRLRRENELQKIEVLNEAKRQALAILADSKKAIHEKLQILEEDFAQILVERKEDLALREDELKAREQFLQGEESRLGRLEKDLEEQKQKAKVINQNAKDAISKYDSLQKDLIQSLESRSQSSAENTISSLKEQVIESRQLETQKELKTLQDILNTSANRFATRLLSRSLARYAPDFYWPKMVNHVDVTDPKLLDALGNKPLIAEIKEKAGIEIEIVTNENRTMPPILKLAGGMGIDREAARLALAELIEKGVNAWHKAAISYDHHRRILEAQAVRLGLKAVEELELDAIHPEIQKMVGYLYWRTSYRQNQWYHSVEVAKLAGLIAAEVGVDPKEAKRCGLLHDIGKSIDYRIEGSHAIISGDYADRFGEKRWICDTVMSHHNDLIIETPLAFVLKSADTLSGARPGARVNLEEGYQIRLGAINDVVNSFNGVTKSIIMNGGREVHIEVNHKKIDAQELKELSANIAKKIESDVAFPGQIKVLVSRRFEAVAVA